METEEVALRNFGRKVAMKRIAASSSLTPAQRAQVLDGVSRARGEVHRLGISKSRIKEAETRGKQRAEKRLYGGRKKHILF